MQDYTFWFVAALVIAGVEMATGTFYMLVVALAVALGGVAALASLEPAWQYAIAGIAAVAGTLALRGYRRLRPAAATSADNLDVGQPVKVVRWNEDGTARVHYRGTDWDAAAEGAHTPRQGPLYIKSVQGNILILTHHKP